MTGSLDKSALSKNNENGSVSSKNNNSKPVFGKNNGDSKVDRFCVNKNDVEYAKKLEKLFKSRKSKSEKLF